MMVRMLRLGLLTALALIGLGTVAYAQDASLPQLPALPVLDTDSYPQCREDHQAATGPLAQADAVNGCIGALDSFNNEVLLPYQQWMAEYQIEISRIYIDDVSTNTAYSPQQRSDFFTRISEEHAASNPDGPYMADYRTMEARYQEDRAYLQDRFCFYTGCNGYAAPVYAAAGAATSRADNDEEEETAAIPKEGVQMARADTDDRARQRQEEKDRKAREREEEKERKKNSKKSKSKKCDAGKKGGGLFGGIIGGVVGQATGIGAIGGFIAGQFAGLLVAEIACQLDEKEQEQAAEATVAVTEKEEVGASEVWRSETRPDVTGSSTIAAVDTQPNGRSCLDIVDIVIIDGEETRATKRMCRKPGEARYSLAT
ncbi:MAG: hypothetical protein R3E02_13360 [Blastomonas sp.]